MKKNIHINNRIALYQPRIPQNTGNIARTCAAFNLTLDLICPLGFSLEDKYLKRAGLDYWKYLDIKVHMNFAEFIKDVEPRRIIGFSKKGNQALTNLQFKGEDILLFGREDIGLPVDITKKCAFISRIPMPGGVDSSNKGGVRSLNLSVACGIVAYQIYSQFATPQ